MDSTCKNCGLKDFVQEIYERVCTSCGDVQEDLLDEGPLCTLPDREAVLDNFRNKEIEANQRLTGRIRNETNNAPARKQIGREKILDDMRKIVKQLIKHSSAVDETMNLIEATFKAYKSRLLNSKKLGLVGACVYYVSAKHQLGISLADVCKVINIRLKIISVCLKQVKQLCPFFEYDRPNIKDLVKNYVDKLANKQYDFSALDVSTSIDIGSSSDRPFNATQPLITTRDRIVLENRIMLLIDLFDAMHPYNQPTAQSLITAVVYHAWKSLDTFKIIAVNLGSGLQPIPSSEESEKELNKLNGQPTVLKSTIVKHKISFEKFCQICDLKYSSNGYKIVSKLQSSLLMLGKHLGDVNKINLPWYLKDIIENSSQLIQAHSNRAVT